MKLRKGWGHAQVQDEHSLDSHLRNLVPGVSGGPGLATVGDKVINKTK